MVRNPGSAKISMPLYASHTFASLLTVVVPTDIVACEIAGPQAASRGNARRCRKGVGRTAVRGAVYLLRMLCAPSASNTLQTLGGQRPEDGYRTADLPDGDCCAGAEVPPVPD